MATLSNQPAIQALAAIWVKLHWHISEHPPEPENGLRVNTLCGRTAVLGAKPLFRRSSCHRCVVALLKEHNNLVIDYDRLMDVLRLTDDLRDKMIGQVQRDARRRQ